MAQRYSSADDDDHIVEFPTGKSDGNGGLFKEWRRVLVDGYYRHEEELGKIRGEHQIEISKLYIEIGKIRAEIDGLRQKITWAYAFSAGAAVVIGVILKFVGK